MSSSQANHHTFPQNSDINMDGEPPMKKQKPSEDSKPKKTDSGAPEYMSHRWYHETPEGKAARTGCR